MVTWIAEWLFACLDPQISEELRVGLDGVPFVVVVGCVYQLEAEVVPYGSQDCAVYFEEVQGGLGVGYSFDGEVAFGV